MGNFERAFSIVVGIEAGYVNDPNDPGGETKYGISKRAYPQADIAALTLDDAKAIYERDYWQAVSGDALPWPLACFVFDCAVNQGQETARVLLQSSLGVATDGVIGKKTLAAVALMKPWDNAHFLTVRAKRYMQSSSFNRYGDGWFNRLFVVALTAGG